MLTTLTLLVATTAAATPPAAIPREALTAQLERLAEAAGGRVAIAALHVESGERFSLRGDQGVFMASVIKLPVAVAVLARAERGELSIDPTVSKLLEAAVSDSDNTASDALQRLLGGPAGTAAELRRLKLDGIDVSRTYAEWVRDAPQDAAQRQAVLADRRDRATPEAMVQLLARLQRGELLGPAGTAHLLRLMTDTRNPAGRLRAGVPPGTRVAHKTGTWGNQRFTVAVNDVGLITLPDGTHLAVALMVGEPKGKSEDVEPVMARLTRALYAAWADQVKDSW